MPDILRVTTCRDERGAVIVVKKIMRDPLFLAQKSEDATEEDRQAAWQVFRLDSADHSA